MVDRQLLPGNVKMKKRNYQKDTNNFFEDESSFEKARGARMVVYTGICRQEHTAFSNGFIDVAAFETHLAFYKKYFNLISVDDYYSRKFSNNRFNICLTFDNGLANNYTYALPLLEKYQAPAAFFITAIRFAGFNVLWNDFLTVFSKSGPGEIVFKNTVFTKNKHDKYISSANGRYMCDMLKEKRFDDKEDMMATLYPLFLFKEIKELEDVWLQMTTQQIKLLSASRFATIGSHGLYHNDLGNIHLAYARNELVVSKRYLEDIIGKKITSLAFPYGSYTKEVVAAAKEAGYTQLLAMDFDNSEYCDPAIKQRFVINADTAFNAQMRAVVAAKHD